MKVRHSEDGPLFSVRGQKQGDNTKSLFSPIATSIFSRFPDISLSMLSCRVFLLMALYSTRARKNKRDLNPTFRLLLKVWHGFIAIGATCRVDTKCFVSQRRNLDNFGNALTSPCSANRRYTFLAFRKLSWQLLDGLLPDFGAGVHDDRRMKPSNWSFYLLSSAIVRLKLLHVQLFD